TEAIVSTEAIAPTEDTAPTEDSVPIEETAPMTDHLMIEARTPKKGLEMAIQSLRKLHLETGTKNQVVKISGEKLSEKGIFATSDKLAGKDLIIEEAGDLSGEALEELQILIEEDRSGMIVILIDNPMQMEELHRKNPELAKLFECIGVQRETEESFGETVSKQTEGSEQEAQASAPELCAIPVTSDQTIATSIAAVEPPEYDSDEEMDLDEFADYACKYAGEIDCSITGKSLLALYEKIEVMEEDGIPLTKITAEDMIEEAADKAEKPSLGRLLTGVFSTKYDKDGLLILKEEHFID
ncbi:MAG: hypothetical protein RSB57_08930, partial [Hungatella sp.]